MPAQDDVGGVLVAFGKSHTLRRRASTWYVDGIDAIGVVNLQRSKWGSQYYVNVGLWLRALGDSTSPSEVECHVRTRIGRILPSRAEELVTLLDLEADVTTEDRRARLGSILERDLFPLIQRLSNTSDLTGSSERRAVLAVSLVTLDAQRLLGLASDGGA